MNGRERPDDRGAVATLIAILLGGGVLLGMAALSVDVGQVYAERRQVQNGADAAALAVAMDCADSATCDTATSGQARTLANGNANDGQTSIVQVCGAGSSSLAGCGAATGPTLTRCGSALPAGAEGWVQVRTGTATTGGGTLLPPSFARALAGNAGYAGTQVLACARAAWGSPGSVTNMIPLTISICEWRAATTAGYAPPPPYASFPTSYERALKLHTTTADDCSSSGGAGADLPGGFGWLDGGAACVVTATAGGTVPADPGVASGPCTNTVPPMVDHIVYLPVYDDAWGTGANGRYHIAGFAAFYLTGYFLPSAHPTSDSPYNSAIRCRGSDKCIYGWFTQGLIPNPGTIGGGTGMGAKVVTLAG